MAALQHHMQRSISVYIETLSLSSFRPQVPRTSASLALQVLTIVSNISNERRLSSSAIRPVLWLKKEMSKTDKASFSWGRKTYVVSLLFATDAYRTITACNPERAKDRDCCEERDKVEGGLRRGCRDPLCPWKLEALALLVRGKDADDMNGRCKPDPSIGCVGSRSGLDGLWSPNRADQQALRISSANRRVRSSAASRASTTTCLNPKRASREGFGVDGRAPGRFS